MATRSRSSVAGRYLSRSRSNGRLSAGTKSSRFLIDNSVWARLSTTPEIVGALQAIVDLASPDDVLVCAPIAIEVGFSARTGADHATLMEWLAAFPDCGEHPTAQEAMSIQGRLWNGGLLRAAGAMDTLIAAYALKNDATLIHYDRDFEHIASVTPHFRHQWIVPRGSID